MRNAIFITFDDAYSEYAKKCLQSLEKNYPDHPRILAFYSGADGQMIKLLRRIKNLEIGKYPKGLLKLDGIDLGPIKSEQVYNRYLLWTSYFDQYDTIVHLDVDTIILKPFSNLFLKRKFFAIYDLTPNGKTLFRSDVYDDQTLIKLLSEDGLNLHPRRYLMMNAGVFVIPRKYRTDDQFSKLWCLTKKYNKYMGFADQSAISLWCYLSKIDFSYDIKYNFQLAFLINPMAFYSLMEALDTSASSIRIVHYSWWKPTSRIYIRFIEFMSFFRNFIDYTDKLG